MCTKTAATWGQCLVADPGAVVLAQQAQGPGVVLADLDPERLRSVRQQLPASPTAFYEHHFARHLAPLAQRMAALVAVDSIDRPGGVHAGHHGVARGRYEASQVQTRLERDAADAVSDVRVALNRNLQSLQALHASDPGLLAWEVEAAELLRLQRELVRLEWRDNAMRLRTHVQTPYRALMGGPGHAREQPFGSQPGVQHRAAPERPCVFRQLPPASRRRARLRADGAVPALSVNGRASGF